ncbi:YgfZ/GcvT domain-containing protein [Caldimonas thermodepolymerans]|mgnify:CR=1 FL=1|jgi:folate-binding protein YgfZ|uniref:CAF17-like 4Fe-4S cluster assembly/insertion protein YgfZ n=1 Tax=Caldimonas thermodepolymerans TaxID=215580 RepID=UPI0024903A5B|nr:folate-binding protein [Caldimonas thermodepolymerans]
MTTDSFKTSTMVPQGAVQLTHWGVIAVDGADAASFLHGQLTQDFSLLGADEARLAGYCSPKGRLLASFVGWKESSERVLLACSADLLAPTLKRLSMFVLRAKAKLSDASAEVRLWGLAGDAATGWLADAAPTRAWGKAAAYGGTAVRLPDAHGSARYLWAAPADRTPDLPALDAAIWRWLEVESAVARICAATVDQFVPQMVNLEAVGGVNFKKGCYPGQEVVARSQYRGTLKRRGYLLACPAEAVAGQEVFHSGDPGQPCGMVVDAAAAPEGGWSVFAELKIAATESGTLHLGSPQGPALTLRVLPYALPSEP